MTTQHQVIALCVIGFIAVPVGCFTIVKCINKLIRLPENTLHRRNDIELTDYIEPTQSYIPDLLNPQYPTFERITTLAPTYQTGVVPPSYRTGILLPYQSVEYINSPLELNTWNFSLLLTILSIIITGFIFFKYLNTKSLYNMSILIPFSLFEIDFRDSFEWELKSHQLNTKPTISYLKIESLTEDIIKLLNSLNDDENYSMSFSYISSYKEWVDNKKKTIPLFIDDPIIINKESDPIIITQFIMNRLNDKGYFVTNWLFKDDLINSLDPLILIVSIPIIIKI